MWPAGVASCGGGLCPGVSGASVPNEHETRLRRPAPWGWVRGGVGLLFEIWIVDASIKFFFVVVSSVHHQPGVPAACCVLDCDDGPACCWLPLSVGGGWWWVGLLCFLAPVVGGLGWWCV